MLFLTPSELQQLVAQYDGHIVRHRCTRNPSMFAHSMFFKYDHTTTTHVRGSTSSS